MHGLYWFFYGSVRYGKAGTVFKRIMTIFGGKVIVLLVVLEYIQDSWGIINLTTLVLEY